MTIAPNSIKCGLHKKIKGEKCLSVSEQKIDLSVTEPIKWFRDLGFDRLQLKTKC
ncbi:protein of unknown function [Paenibacillus alvei]|uniref:Uncharacterized protein n=1 Tax=Paenibacillus alvei TaxID=44250 RepID=A0A383RC38_PAEAL|nr:protein of unknown function [Paenibacillus alvei]